MQKIIYNLENTLYSVDIAKHMVDLGLASLSHALQHTFFYNEANEYWNSLAVLQAAHAAEILIKACIAEKDPLQIFESLPDPLPSPLMLESLLESGRTVRYSELPNRLEQTTGYRIKESAIYQEFGKLRNQIQHFLSIDHQKLLDRNLDFIFKVVDPLINDFWEVYAVDYVEDMDAHEYIFDTLFLTKTSFLIPKEKWYLKCVENACRNLGLNEQALEYKNRRLSLDIESRKPSRITF